MSLATIPQPSVICDPLSHMLDSVDKAETCDKPFSHFFVRQVFPPQLYAEMLGNLPDPTAYQPIYGKQLPDGKYPRTYYQLDREGLSALPSDQRQIWTGVVEAVLSEEFKAHVFRQLRRDLANRFGTDDVTAIEASPRPRIVRDTAGYRIPPHPDTRKKAVTMMIYLPSDESQNDLGTSLYKISPTLKSRTSGSGWFKEVKRFPFLPNSGFAFAVSNSLRKKSWHGRERLSDDAGVRNSLVTTFYLPGTVDYERY